MIWRNAAKARRHEGRNDIAVEVAPGGHAVEQQHDRPTPWSLIEVMNPKPFPGMPMGSKVKILQPCKIVLGGSKNFCHGAFSLFVLCRPDQRL